ncbi:MAG: hypothetical protein MJ094_00985 [Saccharofermentans sp.]|nr:hypothetical protein [Saccharofermentans sp.]
MQTARETEFWECVHKKVMEYLRKQDKSTDTSVSIPAGEALGYIEGYEKNGCSPDRICRYVAIQMNWDCDAAYSYGFDRRGEESKDIGSDIQKIIYDTMKEMDMPEGTVSLGDVIEEYHEYVKKYGC